MELQNNATLVTIIDDDSKFTLNKIIFTFERHREIIWARLRAVRLESIRLPRLATIRIDYTVC